MTSFHSITILLLATASAYGHATTNSAAPAHTDEAVILENFVTTAAPFKRDQFELAAATSVLSGRELALKQASSIGMTLNQEPGIASSDFGPGASRPIIRGLGGDRVRILTDGVGTIDASITSPDHAVSIEPLLAERIEVVRGPATLLYGSNAVGGVVNVIDERIPETLPTSSLSGQLAARASSAADERALAGSFQGAAGPVAWHVDALKRTTHDVDIPGFANHAEPAFEGRLFNSATETDSVAAGLSIIGAPGFIGVSTNHYDTDYGTVAEPDVTIKLRQRRYDFAGALTRPFGIFSGVRAKLGLADYAHTEFEGTEVGTRFQNKGYEGRAELLHEKLSGISGSWGVQTSRSDFSAIGEEAFLPPSLTHNHALFVFEEFEAKPTTLQLGARFERQSIQTQTGLHRTDTLFSASSGLVQKIGDSYALAASLARTERAPNAQELFSDGPHIGTHAYEIGDAALSKETSLGIDLGLRKRTGLITGTLSVFANRFDSYVFEQFSGQQDPDDGLDIYHYVQRDVSFYGAELETLFHLHEGKLHTLDLHLTADTVRAQARRSHEALPRITPRRASIGLDYKGAALSANFRIQGVDRARHLAPLETRTGGYALVNAAIGYHLILDGVHCDLFLRGTNLTNREARNHVSFLKDLAPLPGRDFTLGLSASF